MKRDEEFYTVELCGVTRQLPLVEVAPGIRVALFNIMGDTEIVKAVVPTLASLLPDNVEVLAHPEGKGIPLAYEMSAHMGIPYFVPRKDKKPYMLDPISVDVKSITTGKPQQLWLDSRELPKIQGKNIAIVDDVISTGSTLTAMEKLVTQVGGVIVAKAAIFTEGDERDDVITLGHLPLFGLSIDDYI